MQTKMSNTDLPNSRTTYLTLKDLPKYPVPKERSSDSKLVVRDEVRTPISIPVERLRSLPTVKLSEDFRCLEGWVVKDVLWEGVSIKSILQIAGLKESAGFILFSSGEYTYAMNLKKAFGITTLLALKQSGRWLTRSRGGPIRLVFEGHNCYESVKRVTRIDVLARQPADTARDMAMSRIRAV